MPPSLAGPSGAYYLAGMAADSPAPRLVPRIPRGFRDIFGGTVAARDEFIARVRRVYERYGFSPLETPAIEYVDVLGKFLPESDRPDAGIFSFREDEDWLALRYDLTAPLSRVFAMYAELPKPYRRYQCGLVYRNELAPGPGRYREFYQFDFDSVGAASIVADAECCCIAADTLEGVGVARGEYVVQVSHRRVLNGLLEALSRQPGRDLDEGVRTHILRTVDKLDRVGMEGVHQLLGPGRMDPSGDFTRGVGLSAAQIAFVERFLHCRGAGMSRAAVCDQMAALVGDTAEGQAGIRELREIDAFLNAAGYAEDRVAIDPTVVRGLAYYTGPVFEAVLTQEIVVDGAPVRFGTVLSGGRYDDLVQRFTGKRVPAVGASIGVDRLLAALAAMGRINARRVSAAVLVTTMDKPRMADYQAMATELRQAGINTELYVGDGGIGKQFKYANDTGKTVAVIVGEDEAKAGIVSLKDMRLGLELSQNVGDRKTWLEQQPAQVTAPRAELVAAVKNILARYGA